MKFCTIMYLDNLWKSIEFPGRISKVKVILVSGIERTRLFSLNVEKIVVDNAVFHLSIA